MSTQGKFISLLIAPLLFAAPIARAQDGPRQLPGSFVPQNLPSTGPIDPYLRSPEGGPLQFRPFADDMIPRTLPVVDGIANAGSDVWTWQLLPDDNIYPFYLADEKASRMALRFTRPHSDNLLADATLGGRFGVFRLGDSVRGPFRRGVQLDLEASAQLRLDMEEDVDVRSVDFRAGLPLSIAFGRLHTRVGYYHLSSHVGDEFLLKNPGFNRLNFSRDVLFAGAGYWITERLRVYGEVGWAFYSDISEQWEFNFGIESVPTRATGWRGAPYWAIHSRIREELDYGGSLAAQIGWAWRSSHDSGLLRLGLMYYEGQSSQWSFFDNYEPLVGAGIWYDY